MSQDADHQQLRTLFHEQLANDANNTPGFDRVWSAAARRYRMRVCVMRLLPFAAALLVGAALSFFPRPPMKPPMRVVIDLPTLEARELPWRTAVLLTEWRAPSDAILPKDFRP